MKVLHEEGNYALAILDSNNYGVYDVRTRVETVNKETGKKTVIYKYKYFGSMESAIRELSRLIANETANDLPSWIKSLHEAHRSLQELVSVA